MKDFYRNDSTAEGQPLTILFPVPRVEFATENRNHVIIVSARIIDEILNPRIECGVI